MNHEELTEFRRNLCGKTMQTPEIRKQRVAGIRERMASGVPIKKNTSGVTGVYRTKKSAGWCAQIQVDGKSHYLGTFKDFDKAVKARQNAEREYWGIGSDENSD